MWTERGRFSEMYLIVVDVRHEYINSVMFPWLP